MSCDPLDAGACQCLPKPPSCDGLMEVVCPPLVSDVSGSTLNLRTRRSIANDPTFIRFKSLRDDTPKALSGFNQLSKPVFNLYGKNNSETRLRSDQNQRKGLFSRSLSKLGGSKLRRQKCSRGKSKSPTNECKRGVRKTKSKSRSPKGKSRSRTKGKSKTKSRSKSKGKSKSKRKQKSKSKSKDGSKPKGKSKSKGRSESRKGKSRSTKKGKDKSSSSKSTSRKKRRGRSKDRHRHKKRGPTNTPAQVNKPRSALTRLLNLEEFNNAVSAIQICAHRSPLQKLRRYASEEYLHHCRDFPLDKPMRKFESMSDLILSSQDYMEHLNPRPYDEEDFNEIELSPAVVDTWMNVFDKEARRNSFYNMLFAKKYVTDSLEIPATALDSTYLIEAEDDQYCSTLDFGRMVFKSKHMYLGNLNVGYFNGLGRYCWLDGSSYQGNFEQGQPHGNGTYCNHMGDIYEGRFDQGRRTSDGVYTTPDGVCYTGDWEGDIPHGYGKIWYTLPRVPWDSYEGFFVNGLRDGFGLRQYRNNDKYSGSWKQGLRHGFGTMLWHEQRQLYQGEWQNGVQQGAGILVWFASVPASNGDSVEMRHVFKGNWENGNRHGVGRIFYPNGSIYEGKWVDGRQEGTGKFMNADGSSLLRSNCLEMVEFIGNVETQLDRKAYEIAFYSFVEAVEKKYADSLPVMDNSKSEFRNLTDLCHTYYFEMKLLYKRARKLGNEWNCDETLENQRNCDCGSDNKKNTSLLAILQMADDLNVTPCNKMGLWALLKDCIGQYRLPMTSFEQAWQDLPTIGFRKNCDPFDNVFMWQEAHVATYFMQFLQCLVIAAVELYKNLSFEERQQQLKKLKEKMDENLGTPKPEIIVNHEDQSEVRTLSRGQQTATRSPRKSKKKKKQTKNTTAPPSQPSRSGDSLQSISQLSDDVIDLPPLEEGSVGRSSSQILHQDRDTITDFNTTPANVPTRSQPIRQSVLQQSIEEEHLSLTEIFHVFLEGYLLPYFNRSIGFNLPKIPDKMKPLRCLNDIFRSINDSGLISGKELIFYILPKTKDYDPPLLFWARTSEPMTFQADYQSLFDYVKEDSVQSSLERKKNIFDLRKEQNDQEEVCLEDEIQGVFQLGNDDTTRQSTVKSVELSAPLEFTEQEVASIERITDFDLMLHGAEPCKPDNHLLPGEEFYRLLKLDDVLKGINFLYPNLMESENGLNWDFKLIFCDWLWILLTCYDDLVKKFEEISPLEARKQIKPKFVLPDAEKLRNLKKKQSENPPVESSCCSNLKNMINEGRAMAAARRRANCLA